VVEAQFELNHVTGNMQKYYFILNALSLANIDMVHHIEAAEPSDHSYRQLRDAQVATHACPVCLPDGR
jgi:hypothetical protein